MNDEELRKTVLDLVKLTNTYTGACLLVGWFQGGIRQIIDMLNSGDVDKAKAALEGLYSDGNQRIDHFFYEPYRQPKDNKEPEYCDVSGAKLDTNQQATENKEQAPE